MRRWVLVLSGALFLCGWADSGRAEESAAGKPLSPAEASVFAYVPGDAVVLLSARPATVFKHELIAGFPGVKESMKELAEELRMDPQTMARATAALWHGEGYFFPGRPSKPRLEEPAADADALPEKPGAPDSFEPPNIDAVFIVQLTKPFDAQDFEAKHPLRKFTDESYKGIKYRTANGLAYYMPNRTTLIVTQPVNMKSVLEAKAQAKPAKIVERAMKHGLNHDAAMFLEFASFRPLLKAWLRIAGDRTAGILELPDRLEQLTARVDFQERVDFQLVVETNQEAAAKTVHAIYGEGHEFFMQQLPELSRELKREMGEELGGELAKFLKEAYSAAKAEAAGKRVTVSLRTPPVPKPLVKRIAAWQQARDEERAKKIKLQQIGIACHIYHEAAKKFPFAAGDKLSWRVHLLPSLNEQELYKKFHLDEPWDSEHNKKLLDQMPDVFKHSPDAKAGHTQYVAPEGDGFIVDGQKERRIRDIIDGCSNTLIVVTVKADKAQPWTKPGGFKLDPQKATEVLDNDSQGFLGLLCDGSVRRLNPKRSVETFNALFTIGGLERIDHSIFEKR